MAYTRMKFEGISYNIKTSRDIKKCIVCNKKDRFIEEEEKSKSLVVIYCSCSPDIIVDYYNEEKKYREFLRKCDRTKNSLKDGCSKPKII